MSSTASTVDRDHPITAACARIQAELDSLVDTPPWSMPAEETRGTLVALTKAATQLAELELRVAGHAEQTTVGEETGATSTASWWAHVTRQTRAEAHRKVRLASALDRHDETRAAMARGEVLGDQARVIIDAVDALPEAHEQAEKHLLCEAAHHDAKACKILGRRVFEVIAPELAEAHEAKLLEREERDAAAAARFTMAHDGHGKTYGRFTLPSLHGEMLRKVLLGIAAPKHQRSVGFETGASAPSSTTAERMGRAFLEYVERYPTNSSPRQAVSRPRSW